MSAAGDAGDILAVRADGASFERLRALSPRLRALGFRYVALELDPPG